MPAFNTLNIRDEDESTIVTALYTAAEAYRGFAKTADQPPHIAKQFTEQAKDARELAERIEAGPPDV